MFAINSDKHFVNSAALISNILFENRTGGSRGGGGGVGVRSNPLPVPF